MKEDIENNVTQEAEPEKDLASLFHRASRLMARMYHRNDHAHHAQHRVYSVIRERGPLPQRELLEILGVRSASLSEILTKLERNGRITRTRNDNDKRGFIVSATDTSAGTKAQQTSKAASQDLFGCLDKTEQAQLNVLLTKVIDSLESEHSTNEHFHGRHQGENHHCCHDGHGRKGERGHHRR
jgi:DNA-binding MarR family transcriptional regulator